MKMEELNISFLEKNDIPEASRVLSEAVLKNPLHVTVFQGDSEKERKLIEKKHRPSSDKINLLKLT